MHTTRGRANLLRLVMTGELPAGTAASTTRRLHEALDLCLQCKACKTECPSKVDMAKLKAEVLHQHYQGRPRPLGHLLLGQIFRLNPIALGDGPAGQLRCCGNPAFKWLLEKVAGIDRRRTLPTFARDHFRKWFRRHAADARAGTRGTVVLLDDCFTTYNDPEVGIAAVRVLEAVGLSGRAGGPGLLRPAGDLQGALAAGSRPGRGECPEAPAGSRGRDADRRLRAELPGDAGRRVPRLPPGPGRRTGCRGRAAGRRVRRRPGSRAGLAARARSRPRAACTAIASRRPCSGTAGTVAALRRVPGLEVQELDSGCCGMAGSFGYEHGHYEVSEALANRVLIPGRRRPTRRPAGRTGFLVPQPGARPGRDSSRAAPDRRFWLSARHEP